MEFDRRPLAALSVGWFMVIVDSTIVNVALPSLGRDLHASVSGLQWVLDAYTVTFAGLLLSAGWLGDRLGSRAVFQWGLGVFGLASAGCALSPSLGVLVAARVVQGCSAAALVPASLALVQSTYHERDQRARAVAIWAMVGGVAGGLGPLAGGVLTGLFGWRAMFWVNVPTAALGLWLVARRVPGTDRDGVPRPPLDVPGQLAGAVALLAATAGVVEAGRVGWAARHVWLLLAAAALAAVALVVIERRSRHPLLSADLLADRSLSAALGVGFAINFAYYGSLFVLALYLERAYRFSPLATGAALVPQTAATVLGTWVGGQLNRRHGPRRPMLIGLPIGAAGLATIGLLSSGAPYPALLLPMFAAGMGISFSMVAATSAVVEGAPAGQAGIASGALNASRQVGGALGIALLGTLVAASQGTTTGWRTAFLTGALAYLVGLACATLVSAGHQAR
jgi:DHA2 family methylenomycin A resistance protein-like MFS transporter